MFTEEENIKKFLWKCEYKINIINCIFDVLNTLFVIYMFGKTEKKGLTILIAIGLIHIAYFIVAVIYKNIYLADSQEYLQQAYNIKNHFSFYCQDFSQPLDMHFFTKRPPIYGLFVVIIDTFFKTDFAVLFFQSILSFVNIVGVITLLDRFKFSFDFRKLMLILVICLPVQFIYCNLIMSEILLQTFIFWSFCFFFLYTDSGKAKYIILYNVFLALAVLTKPVLVYFWAPNLAISLYLYFKRRQKKILISWVILPLAVVSFSLYNYYTTGYYHYSSSKHINLVGYFGAFLNVKVYGEEEGINKMIKVKEHLDSIKGFPALLKEEEKIGYEMLMSHKYEFMKFYAGGMVNFFMDPGRFDINNFLGIKESNNSGLLFTFTKEGYYGVFKFIINQPPYIILYIILMIIVNIVLVISCVNIIWVKAINKDIKILFFTMLLYLSFFSGVLGTMRYKVHIIPLMLFSVPFLYESIKLRILKRKTQTA